MLGRPLSAAARVLRAERYDIILGLCTATVVLTVTGADVLTAISGIVGLVLIAGTLIETSMPAAHRARAWILLVAMGCIAAAELVAAGSADARAGPAIVMLMGFAAAVTVTRQVLSRPFPNTTSIAASACAYLLIGYSFASLYILIDRSTSGAFLASGDPLTPESAIYFSFVTLTTLGFGDLAPAPSSGRTLVTLEAMVGQFYIAIAVARLVAGMAVGAGASDRPEADPEASEPEA